MNDWNDSYRITKVDVYKQKETSLCFFLSQALSKYLLYTYYFIFFLSFFLIFPQFYEVKISIAHSKANWKGVS